MAHTPWNVLWSSITLEAIYFAGRWDDCIQVVRLHHACHPKSAIAEQAHRNNLKGLFMVRVSIDSTVKLAILHHSFVGDWLFRILPHIVNSTFGICWLAGSEVYYPPLSSQRGTKSLLLVYFLWSTSYSAQWQWKWWIFLSTLLSVTYYEDFFEARIKTKQDNYAWPIRWYFMSFSLQGKQGLAFALAKLSSS